MNLQQNVRSSCMNNRVNPTIRQVPFSRFLEVLVKVPEFADSKPDGEGRIRKQTGLCDVILNHIKKAPASIMDISEALGLKNKEVHSSVRTTASKKNPDIEVNEEIHEGQSIRVCRVVGDESIYAFTNKTVAAERRGRILALCADKLMTAKEIHQALGVTISTVHKDINYLSGVKMIVKDTAGKNGLRIKAVCHE